MALLTVRMETHGARALSGTFTSTTGPTTVHDCATAARQGNAPFGAFVLAGPGTTQLPAYFLLRIKKYGGPGRYASGRASLDDISLLLGDPVDFRPAKDAQVSMTIRDDASGQATFSGYSAPTYGALSGHLTWTCSATSPR